LVAQKRERIFLVGFREPTDWTWPHWPPVEHGPKLGSVLETNVDPKYTLSDRAWAAHQARRERNRAAGKGFGYSMFGPGDTTRTISARYGKDGSEALVEQPGRNPRKLTPREALRLQGFPDTHQIVCSDIQTYRQAGNAVAVPVVEALARQVVAALDASAWARPSA
jgi:DNA (cytosine-5)-methyltransferase 1